ncbi:hypothetical protein GJAV_G00258010 [Gymnothorax javanicus]|nr:hypothetical protein GJAV_G00258010 [Gymnothorax javanicus]
MGCTPSKSIATYTQERVCQDLDTCSTFVPSLKSSVSTPERPSPRLCLETASGKQTFLSVPCRDSHGRTPSQPNSPDAWSTFSTASNTNPLCTPQPSTKHSRSDSESSDCETPSGNAQQDAVLLSYMSISRVKRCRVADDRRKKFRSIAVKYFIVNKAEEKKPVCKETFMSILGVRKDRLSHIARYWLEKGTPMPELRGGKRPNKEQEQQKCEAALDTHEGSKTFECEKQNWSIVLEKDCHHKIRVMDCKWASVGNSNSLGPLQCAFCMYQCKSNATFQIHIGTSHPIHCDEMDMGRLGKIIFYQKGAKLFHCQECYFTGKTYMHVYDHVLVSHSFSGKDKSGGNGDPKDNMSDSNDSKDVLDSEINDEEKPTGGDGEVKSGEVADFQAPAKFAPLNSVKTEEEELNDEDSRHSSSPSQPGKRKRESASDEEAPIDTEEFSDFSGKSERDTDEKQAEEVLLSKYVRRIGGRYYCKICNWRGKMKGFMFHHVSKKHDIPRPYACKECPKAFLLESMLASHINLFHKQGIYQCPYCSFCSNFIRGVRRHLNNCNARQGEGSYDSDEQD